MKLPKFRHMPFEPWRVAIILFLAILMWGLFWDWAHSCALPSPRQDQTGALFTACLHAPRSGRHQCEADYIAYAGSVRP